MIENLKQFKLKNPENTSPKYLRKVDDFYINVGFKKITIICDICGHKWSGSLQKQFDKSIHLCKTCKPKRDRNILENSTVTNGAGVYIFENLVTKKVYVGSSKNMFYRCKTHLKKLNDNNHLNPKLQNSWNKHGKDKFKIYVKETVKFSNDKKILKKRLMKCEQHYIDTLDCIKNGYNIVPTAFSNLGYHHTQETKDKISKANKGRTITEETRINLRLSHLGNKPTEETRRKMSVSHKNANHKTTKYYYIANNGKEEIKIDRACGKWIKSLGYKNNMILSKFKRSNNNIIHFGEWTMTRYTLQNNRDK